MSVVDTEYAACACSPLGKVKRVSQPHAPGATPVWTTYTYDGSGRTLTVTQPDASTTTYVYQGAWTNVWDPAGKWKAFHSNAMGNLTTVLEANPAGGPHLETYYGYNAANQLTNVSMTRPVNGQNVTQNRTFVWSGKNLTSTTNPENGTVTYQYNAAGRVTLRTDAKGQQAQYTYDAYGRRTSGPYTTYYYDTNPVEPAFSLASHGRLTRVQFAVSGGLTMSYDYSYNAAGRVTRQRLNSGLVYLGTGFNPEAGYAWDK